MKSKKKIYKKIILLVLPTAIIPLIIIMFFISIRIYLHIQNQERRFYYTIVSQITKKFDYIYDQYARTITNVITKSNIEDGLLVPEYKSLEQEKEITDILLGISNEENAPTGLQQIIKERIDGYCIIYQMDRISLLNNELYKKYKSDAQCQEPRLGPLLNDDLFSVLQKDSSVKMIFGRMSPEVFGDVTSDLTVSPVILFPYYPPEQESDSFTTFLVIRLSDTLLTNLFKNINELQYGTFYILDRFNNILSVNHEDILTANLKKNGSKKDSAIISLDKNEMLNKDPGIIHDPAVKVLLKNLNDDNIDDAYMENDRGISFFEQPHIVKYNNKLFLTILGYSENSKARFVFFYPVQRILEPIIEILSILLIITAIIIAIIIFVSYFMSASFTKPIRILVNATQKIAGGDFTHFIDIHSKDEIGNLASNFNKMIRDLKQYQDRLLSAQRQKSELELASRIQTCLLPAIPSSSTYSISAIMIPASEVGGDYYDIIDEKDGRVWFAIGDVSGHGLASGLIMMMAQTAFNTVLLKNPNISSEQLITQVNRVLYQNIKQRLAGDDFMTLSFIVADPDGQVECVGAHLDILVYRDTTKKVERIEPLGMWLGLKDQIKPYSVHKKFKLEKDDVMFLYTDGLIEAMNENNEQYDMDRLITILENNATQPPHELQDIIIKDVFDFLSEQKDDISFVICKKK